MHLYLAQCQPGNDMMRWMIVLNIENINCLLEAAFKIHLAPKSEGARALALNEHDASAYSNKNMSVPCTLYSFMEHHGKSVHIHRNPII